MERWPNFFIVGAQKAGTTSLYEYLKDIPGIFMSPNKEPNYFSINCAPDNHPLLKPIRNKDYYLGLFQDGSNAKIIGEASPLYLPDPDTPRLIHDMNPTAKIVISLRDPVERAYSHHLMHLSRGYVKSSFHEQIQEELNNKKDISNVYLVLKFGLYSEDVKRYWDVFGHQQVKIIIFEEFMQNPRETVEEILIFLGLNQMINQFNSIVHNPFTWKKPRGPIAEYLLYSKKVNKFISKIIPKSIRLLIRKKVLIGTYTKKPEMSFQDREFLRNFYKEDVKKLEKLLGRKVPWSNF